MPPAEQLSVELPVRDAESVARARAEAERRTIAYPHGSGQGEELALFAGLRSLVRQQLDAASLSRAREHFERRGFVTDTVTDFGKEWRPTRVKRTILFAGRDKATIAGAIAAERTHTDEADEELGRLLGYPRCCIEAFIAVPHPRPNYALRRRASSFTRAAFAPRLNVFDRAVFHFVSWEPCAYDCAPSRAHADAVAELVGADDRAFRGKIDAALAAHRLQLSDNVQLSLLGASESSAVRIERVWATANDRHPDVPLSEQECEAVARALVLVRNAKTVAVEDGVVMLDGAAVRGTARAMLLPFGRGVAS